MRCFNRRCRSIRWHYRHLLEEVPMATQRHGQIVETPTEARQAEPGPSVLAPLSVSTGPAVLILGIVWFVFFCTCAAARASATGAGRLLRARGVPCRRLVEARGLPR